MTSEINESDDESVPIIQQEMIFAFVDGKPITEIPQDLYIPPDALEVMLETFEGPLDLLLYLIRRQNMDVLSVNVSHITKQYMDYIELMKAMRFELAAEYLLMAAMLTEIKSRMLLPRREGDVEDEDDPRAELIRRLQQYERFKQAAEDIDDLPRVGRDIYEGAVAPPSLEEKTSYPDLSLQELMLAFSEVLRRSDMFEHHHIEKETLSTREKMTLILSLLSCDRFTPFESLFDIKEGRLGVVVTFLAVMELIKEQLVELIQNESFGSIHLKARVQ